MSGHFPRSDDFDVLTGPSTPSAPPHGPTPGPKAQPRQVRHVHA